MTYTYTPMGVCARKIFVEIEDGIIKNCEFMGGCNGNTQGVAALVIGMNAKEAVEKLSGIDCNGRGTSCPDQLSRCIKKALEQE
ncbi:MAG: TIGR03905 family TSCPD domain-containing protein [Ruminococcus sp.]|nr:TIGR03905 family TSCPD domain-containing protein [Ruminococcus sp.]